MILNEQIPAEVFDEFQRLFNMSMYEYWDPFWGWERFEDHVVSDRIKFREDYPTLTEEQQALIEKITSLEEQQFDEVGKRADLALSAAEHQSYRRLR